MAIVQGSGFGEDGDLHVHALAGCKLPFAVRDAGIVADVSGAALKIRIGANFTRDLAANPDDPRGRLVVLTTADITGLGAGDTFPAVILDVTDANVPIDLWSGQLKLYR